MNTSRLLTTDEVADILGVNPQTLAVWRSVGRYNLKYIKTGRLVRYKESDVEAFINERTHGNHAA